ncbi:hypothetical protein PVAP13_6KG072370 [Panicum virgatum]|uniref:FAD-binding PCMH-type domain-containing protein n=1 Tax=Panicum virgatum TaxID=38727 RepID=A0A8T0R9F4_PANVG|nr:hypothetical protein PVAP13_6KG072370 [Panicum virgatum]
MVAALALFSLVLRLMIFAVRAAGAARDDDGASFTACQAAAGVRDVTTRGSPGYGAALGASIQNLRFAGAGAPKPAAVVAPASLEELRAAVRCARAAGLVVRLRSGGHSYEGLSYTTEDRSAFAVVDLAALDRVRVDAAASHTAWVEAGATLGQGYHAVAAASPALAFSAGSCPTVGSGGHIAGGGFGLLSRKYGLAGDNVVDAVLVDAEGRVLDRAAMGEDVFWAIRGGGGGAWGAVYAWRVQLRPVPARVTDSPRSSSTARAPPRRWLGSSPRGSTPRRGGPTSSTSRRLSVPACRSPTGPAPSPSRSKGSTSGPLTKPYKYGRQGSPRSGYRI